jgi:hypothetical protein
VSPLHRWPRLPHTSIGHRKGAPDGRDCGGTPELAAIWELLIPAGGRRWLLLVAPLPGGGDGRTPGVAENARSTEVAAAAAHVGLPCATGAVKAVWAAWCARVAQVARGALAGSAWGQRGARIVGLLRGWCHADSNGSWGALQAGGVSIVREEGRPEFRGARLRFAGGAAWRVTGLAGI